MTDSEDGLKTLIAKANSGDATWFMAIINRIADILQVDGDTDPVGARRSKAIGILAQPGLAMQVLIDHQDDTVAPAHDDETHDNDAERDDGQLHAPR